METQVRAFLAAVGLLLGLSGESEFYRATALEREGRFAEAAEVYRGIVEGPFADDAMLESARLYEEQLGDPLRAADTYERLVREHPDSRVAERARRRAEALRQALGPGGAAAPAVAELNAILMGAPKRPRAESIARMERLLAQWPDFPDAPRALFWLGTAELDEGRRAAALQRYREVAQRWPGGDWAARAHRAAGDLLVEDGDLEAADGEYRALAALDAESGAAADARLRGARWRVRWVAAAWVWLAGAALLAVVSVRRAAGSFAPLRRPPAEVLYFLPIAALFAAAGLTEHAAMTRAIAMICAGGLLVAWLSGASLDAARIGARRIHAWRIGVQCIVAVVAVLAVCYIAVVRERLLDFLVETLRFGPER